MPAGADAFPLGRYSLYLADSKQNNSSRAVFSVTARLDVGFSRKAAMMWLCQVCSWQRGRSWFPGPMVASALFPVKSGTSLRSQQPGGKQAAPEQADVVHDPCPCTHVHSPCSCLTGMVNMAHLVSQSLSRAGASSCLSPFISPYSCYAATVVPPIFRTALPPCTWLAAPSYRM